jgi:putative N6-adenine-specific DNA methylase
MSPSAPSRFGLFASTAPGLESIAAGELRAKREGGSGKREAAVRGKQEVGGVSFSGDLEALYKANLWLRTASRVLVRLGQFHASTFYELERRAKKLRWADFLPSSGVVSVRATCRKSRLYHSDAVAERILAAIARAAPPGSELKSSITGEETDEDGSDEHAQLFVVRIVHDECEISADSSGELLHRRGYRTEVAKAPLRETLAAAMVLASGWRAKETLIDPMCGSGTIPIEAALIARGIAPGLNRRFQFMNWPNFDEALWNDIVEQARSSVINSPLDIRGGDRDAGAISAATRNAERAGVNGDIRFAASSLSASIAELEDPADGDGWILTNPPYGVRIGERGDLRDLYATLGAILRNKRGWRIGILTSDVALAGQMRQPLRSRFDSRNGGIPVSFLVSEKVNNPDIQNLEPSSERSGSGD